MNPVDKLLPADENDPQSMRKYRLRQTAMAGGGLAIAIAILAAMGTGWPIAGRLAWAQEVDDKIAKAVTPVQQQVAALTEDTKEIVVDLLASRMREAAAVRCLAAPGSRDRERANREISENQVKYQKRVGVLYAVPTCAEL